MELFEKCQKSETIYKGVVSFHRDEVLLKNGKTSHREYMKHPGACCVLALDEQDHILFVEQFRYPCGKTFLELPAGKLDPNETIEQCALRELQEETGYTTKDIMYMGKIYPSIAFSDEVIHVYFATNLKKGKQQLDEDEFLNVLKIPYEEAVNKIMENELDDSKTTYGILKLMAWINSGRVRLNKV